MPNTPSKSKATNMTDHACQSYHNMTRRGFLAGSTAGLATLLSLNVRDLVALGGEVSARKLARADHVILLWMSGGMSHIDTWDPKPGRETGGEFEAIKTSADGVRISEILPLTAEQMNRALLIRSLSGVEGDHGRATYNLLTNYRQSPQFVHPSLGAIVAHELQPAGDLPTYIAVGGRAPGAGYLGQKCEAYYVGAPGAPDPYVKLPEGITEVRAKKRLDYLKQINAHYESDLPDVDLTATKDSYDAATAFMNSPALKAFELDHENDDVRGSYGDNNFGRGCLLARRLVEAGVRFVQVNMNGFDTHANNFPAMRNLGATIDPAVSSLIRDLHASGKLDRTVVLMMSEFGRTPKINSRAGRDHYPRVFSCMMAGGGLKQGHVVGASDIDGTEVAENKVTPGDVHATVCRQLGIDPAKYVHTPIGRPMKLVEHGKPIADAIA